jgi:peptidoglycan/LPS O-acetylase OafA/YrhL
MVFVRIIQVIFYTTLVVFFFFFIWQANVLNGISNLFDDFGNNNLRNNVIGQFKFTLLSLIFASVIGTLAYSNLSFVKGILNFLEIGILKNLGKISYGLYLYHIPIHKIVKFCVSQCYENSLLVTPLLTLLLTIFISVISWRYFEKPLLELKTRFST